MAAEVSGSQMYHYFPDKNERVQAVIDYQAESIVNRQRHAVKSAKRVAVEPNMVITAAKRTKAKGGCQLGSLVGQLAESDPEARALIAAGFDQWAAAENRRWNHIPLCRRETPVRHRPGRPRYHLARHAPRRTSTRPGATESPPVRDCRQYPSCPCHRQMNPKRVRSQPSPRSAHGPWMAHMHPHDPLAEGCSGLAFGELTQPTLTARACWTWTDLVRMDGIR